MGQQGVSVDQPAVSVEQQVVSFDLQDQAQIDVSHSRGGLPRLSVVAADGSVEVEFVHTVDSDPLVSMVFFSSLRDQAQQAAEDLAHLMSSGAEKHAHRWPAGDADAGV